MEALQKICYINCNSLEAQYMPTLSLLLRLRLVVEKRGTIRESGKCERKNNILMLNKKVKIIVFFLNEGIIIFSQLKMTTNF